MHKTKQLILTNMQNTIENKEKFFALYYLQRVYKWDESNVLDILDNTKLYLRSYESDIIFLNDLKYINDTDFIGLAEIFEKEGKGSVFIRRKDCIEFIGIDYFKLFFNGLISYTQDPYEYIDSLLILQAYDYLRSKGYALPYMGLSVEKQQEYGWVKLKTE